EPSTAGTHAMALAAGSLAPEQLLAGIRITGNFLGGAAGCDRSKEGDDAPDVVLSHRLITAHFAVRNALRDDIEQVGVAIAHRVLAEREIGSAAALALDSVTRRAGDPKEAAAHFDGACVVLERILKVLRHRQTRSN